MSENFDPINNKLLYTSSKNSDKGSVNSSNIPSFVILAIITILMCILIGNVVLAYPKYKLEENRKLLEYYKSIEVIE